MKIAQEILEFFKIEEIAMDTKTAFTVLGLEYGDYDGVDKAFKKMAMQHHPDRGGDPEMMKQVNQAKDALAGGTGSVRGPKDRAEQEVERHEINKVRVAKAKVVTEYIYNKLNGLVEDFEPLLLKHLEKNIGKKFTVGAKANKADNSYDAGAHWSTGSINKWHGHVEWVLKYTSEDKSTIFSIELEGHIDERDFEHALSTEDLDMEVRFETFAYSEGKKTKMQMKRWGLKAKASSLGSPEDFFPSKKLVKMTSTEKTRLTKKADAFAFLGREMDAIAPYTDKDIILIPIGDDKYVRMHRMVWMKTVSWSFDDVMIKQGKYNYSSTMTRGSPESLYKKMTGKDSLSGQGNGTGVVNVMEVMPDFSKIVKTVVELITKEKYREAGEYLAEKGKEYDTVIEPAIKAKTLK